MKYIGYTMRFKTAVHLGERTLDDAGHTIYADTLFSALCHEARLGGGKEGIEKLKSTVDDGKLYLSDAMPICGDRIYVPKPFLRVESDTKEAKADDKLRKRQKTLKKLDYIPWDSFSAYMEGKLDVEKEAEIYSGIGRTELRTMAAVRDEDDTLPYPVGAFRFGEEWGLYFIVSYEDDGTISYMDTLIKALGYSGIGGKRGSGLGKFEASKFNLPKDLEKKLISGNALPIGDGKFFMLLSPGMLEDEKYEELLQDARYMLIRRGGFIASDSFSDRALRKLDSYLFKTGSVFRKPFEGKVLNVAPFGGHPVYRYAKPIFMEVL